MPLLPDIFTRTIWLNGQPWDVAEKPGGGEPRRFCREGENAGKPGPCPEGKGDVPGAAPPAGKARAGKKRVGIVRAWLRSRGWTRRLSGEQKQAAQDYVDNSGPVNRPLWEHPDDWREALTGKARADATALHDALEKAPTFLRPLTVWRGVQLFDKEPAFMDACREALAGGHGLQMAGFLSTTFDADIAQNFSVNVVLEIEARKGAYLSGVGGREAGQSELLLQHNSVFEVAGIETATVAGEGRTVVRLRHRPGAEKSARVVRDVAGVEGTKIVHAEAPPASERFAITSLEGIRLVTLGHAETQKFCQQGPNKGKPGPCPKPKQAAATPGKQPKATTEDAHAHIEQVRANPTPEGVRAVALTLSRMTVKDVQALKQRLGIRAGGNKSALVQKVAHEATRRLTVREKYVREARTLGYSAADLTKTAAVHRQTYNEVADEAGKVLRDARAQYAQFTGGGRLHRGMSAFKGGDWTQIPHFDQIAESLQRRHPELLPGDAQEGYERLFTMLQAGPPVRMSYQSSLEKAMGELQSYGPQERGKRRRPAAAPEEEIPFAEASPDGLHAILDAMLDAAGDPERLAVLAEMAEEGSEPEVEADQDTTPADPEAQKRVAGWLDEMVRGRRKDGPAHNWAAMSEADWQSFAAADWTPYTLTRGPNKGKQVWKNQKTGAISHEDPTAKAKQREETVAARKKAQQDAQAKARAAREAKVKEAAAAKEKAAKAKQQAAAKQKQAQERAVTDIGSMISGEKKPTAAAVKQAAAALLTMTGDQLRALKKQVGAKGGGRAKAELVRIITERAKVAGKAAKKPGKGEVAVKPDLTEVAPENPLLQAAVELEPDFANEDSFWRVDFRHLREKFPGVGKEEFDRSVLALANAGAITLTRNNFPDDPKTGGKENSVTDGQGNYFVGMTLDSRGTMGKSLAAGLRGGPKPPKPGFTGTDAMGRRWANGKLVAKEEQK